MDRTERNYNMATKFFRDMEYADPYHDEWGKFADAMDAVISTPSPVVRCKDCHYGIRNSKEDIFCIKAIYNDKYKRPDWFCADGRKKEDG